MLPGAVKPITVKEFTKKLVNSPINVMSVYILPNGDVLDCRSSNLNHTSFTDVVYQNLSDLQNIKTTGENKLYDSVVENKDMSNMTNIERCELVKKSLINNVNVDQNNPTYSKMLENLGNKIADDDLLVHDMGFVKMGILNTNQHISFCTPCASFHGHRPTKLQKDTAFELADFFFYEYADYSTDYREACKVSEEIDRKIECISNVDMME